MNLLGYTWTGQQKFNSIKLIKTELFDGVKMLHSIACDYIKSVYGPADGLQNCLKNPFLLHYKKKKNKNS